MSYLAGTYIIASDRQYIVRENGEWRRVHKLNEVKAEFKWPVRAFHSLGKSFDGSFCWCYSCLEEFHPKVNNGPRR